MLDLESDISEQIDEISDKDKDYRSSKAEVLNSKKIPEQKALTATEDIPEETVIFIYSDTYTNLRTRTSIQVGKDKHIEAGDYASYTNHSCEPNSKIASKTDCEQNSATVKLITIKPVKKGEELSFDYASTESVLTKKLQGTACLCNSDKCRKTVKSFSELTHKEQQMLHQKGILSQHLDYNE